jgi:hypothetical protein
MNNTEYNPIVSVVYSICYFVYIIIAKWLNKEELKDKCNPALLYVKYIEVLSGHSNWGRACLGSFDPV